MNPNNKKIMFNQTTLYTIFHNFQPKIDKIKGAPQNAFFPIFSKS